MRKQVKLPADIFEIHPNCFVLQVEGDCMMDSIPNGSLIAVCPDTRPAADGSDIAVLRFGRSQYVCRVLRLMGQIVMLHDNPAIRSATVRESDVKILGTVVWVQRPKVQLLPLVTVGEEYVEAVVH